MSFFNNLGKFLGEVQATTDTVKQLGKDTVGEIVNSSTGIAGDALKMKDVMTQEVGDIHQTIKGAVMDVIPPKK